MEKCNGLIIIFIISVIIIVIENGDICIRVLGIRLIYLINYRF